VTPLERHCRWLLRVYPAWYRRQRAEEMLGTLLDASPPGRRWPPLRDARGLIIEGCRARGWVWSAAMLWVVAGLAATGYIFFAGLAQLTSTGVLTPSWMAGGLPLLVLVAGLVRLRGWRPGQRLRAAAWIGACVVGLALTRQSYLWAEFSPRYLHWICAGYRCSIGPGPALASWEQLASCAAWLALGIVLNLILGSSPRPSRSGLVVARSDP
jgi:hypothetical protein